MTKRYVWGGPSVVYGPPSELDEFLGLCVEYGYGYEFEMDGTYRLSSSVEDVTAAVMPTVDYVKSWGIPVHINIEASMSWYYMASPQWSNIWGVGNNQPLTNTVPAAEYETRFGDCLDIFEADNGVSGYTFEDGYDEGIKWLRANTNKVIRNYATATSPVISPELVDVNHLYTLGPDWRMQHIDEWVAELYSPNVAWTQGLLELLQYGAKYSSLRIGFLSGAWVSKWLYDRGGGDDLWHPTGWDQWSDPFSADIAYMVDIDTQRRLYYQFNRYLLEGAGRIDVFGLIAFEGHDNPPQSSTWVTSPSYADQFTYAESLNPGGVGTQRVWEMSQGGIIPYYSGASQCGHTSPPPPDTFTNTGNEVIMLKSWSGTTSHTITVSGTTPNGLTTTQNYTLTLSPNQGTPIGPYPVDLFGFNPTITYDTTNLYVAIVGEK